MHPKIPISEERILRTKSRGCCAKYRRDLIGGRPGAESNLSEMAHIRGVAGASARHDPSMNPIAPPTAFVVKNSAMWRCPRQPGGLHTFFHKNSESVYSDVNKHRNLILLCATCHKIVDDDPATYTAERLEKMKMCHEAWAERRLVRDSKATSFAEIEVVAKWMATDSHAAARADYAVTPPLKKIRKNGLSAKARMWIKIGMSKSHLVGKYLEAQPDPLFGERLKDGFLAIYRGPRAGEELAPTAPSSACCQWDWTCRERRGRRLRFLP